MLPDGLSAAQMLLVKETAAALAKQLAASQPQGAQATATMVTPSSGVPTATGSLAVPGDAPRRQGETEQRAEAVLLSVAGISAPQQQGTTPVLPEAAGDAHMAKKKKGSGCFRCGKPGHCLNDCTQNICDCCQSPDHLSRNCPLISAPKPTMVMYGLAHEDLMFWEFPFSGMVRPRLENTRMGRVTVSGGQLTIPEIITQLQWIVPEENYQWDVVMVEPNIYRVNFPSKIDLVRVQHFGRFNIPNSEMFMTFDFWTRSVEPAWTAEDVWVRVHDLPSPVLDDFLALWALGSLFGKTKDIDMAFTRANDILRICITCLNSSLIPIRMDVRVHEQFYRLRFEVEGLQPNIASDVHMDDAPNGDGDMEHDGHRENQEDEASRLGSQNDEEKNTTTGGTDVNIPGGANRLEVSPIKFGLLQPLEFMVESPMVTFSESVYEHIKETLGSRQQVVSVCDVQEDSPDEANMICASPVLLTEDLVSSGFQSETLTGQILLKPVQPVMHESTSIGEATSITPTQCATALSANASRAAVLDTMGKISIDDGKASSPSPCMTPVGVNKVPCFGIFNDNDHTNNAFSSPNICFSSKAFGATPICKPSMTEVISFGGITPNSMKGIRSSARLSAQPNADVSQMERAMMLASKRDDVQAQGTQKSTIPSFSAFTDEQIIDKATAIGVSMGVNLDDRLHAARLIKDIEKQRMITFLDTSNSSAKEGLDTVPTCLAVSRASNLCEDLDEEDQYFGEDHSQILIPRKENKCQRKKRSYDKTKVRRSDRLRLKKKNYF
jgi:hypothetical protein